MLYGMYVSAAGAMANSYRQDVVANNLANAETVSFKRDLALMQARRTEAAQSGQSRFTTAMLEGIGGGVFALPTHTDFAPASLDKTDRSYDLALAGEGFFQVRNGSQINYTRDGHFSHDQQDQFVTFTEQLPVLDQAGNPIVIDPNLRIYVNAAGTVSQNGEPVATLAVVDFDDTTKLKKRGGNFYTLSGEQEPRRVQTAVRQGFLEGSGVNPITELVEMMKTQRMFQANVNMLQIQDQTLGLAVSRLGSIT